VNKEDVNKFTLGVRRIPFNGKMRDARKTKGLSQEQLADMLGMNIAYLQKIEGIRAFPTESQALQISDILGVDAEILFPKWMKNNTIKGRSNFNYYMDMEQKAFESREVLELTAPTTEIDLVEQEDLRRVLNEVLNTLNPREKKIIEMRFGLKNEKPKTLEEVSKEFGVTRDRIRQIEARALRKLRHPSRAKEYGLKDYL
jgi:RNA polymerase sigma factor (sigma-70 family)